MNSNTERSLQDQLVALEQDTANEDLFRLAQGRNNALQQKHRKTSSILWPALATSMGSALLIALLYTPTDSLLSPEREIIGDDYYSELAEENFDLYDDLEFYDWLADMES
jgi:hypothetical protein|tara:strand:+ start:1106 stop:1435 length:330 start_codon:yes stop_codon:yes gene_type:complete